MKRLATALSVFLVLVFSCKKPDGNEPLEPTSKDSEMELNITASELGVSWVKGDVVSVLDETGNHEFTAKDDGVSAVFSGMACTKTTGKVVLSPYISGDAFSMDSIRVDVPAEQREFKPASAAWNASASFKMKDVCAALKFSIVSESISMVDIECSAGENASGYIKLSFNGDSGSMTSSLRPSGSKITLLPPTGSNTLKTGEHSVTCIPGSFAAGFKLTVSYLDGSSRVFESKDAASLAAGEILDIGNIEKAEPVDPPAPEIPEDAMPQEPELTEALDIELVFIETPDATSFKWPFASPPVSAISTSFTVGKASFPGEKTAFVLPDSAGGYTFHIYATTGVARNGGSSQGLKFGGAVGDYIQLPAIKGAYLTKVTWVAGGGGGAELVRYDNASVNGGGFIPGGNSLSKGSTFTWTLSGSEKETAYKIRTGSTSPVQAQKILLHYDVNAPNSTDDPSTEFQEVLPDEIPDFSRVGYRWGDKSIPDVPVKITLEAPTDGSDAFNLIQNAINTVETPGAILLKAGTYNISDIIQLSRSGVVLRGEGEDKTILYSTASTQQSTLVQIGAIDRLSTGTSSTIIAKYVPVGQMWVPVRNPELFSVGERVWVYRPATDAWLDALHMRDLSSYYSGCKDWTAAEYSMCWERKIMKIEGYKIWLDNPVVMCIGGDESYGTGYLLKGSWSRIEECGIEQLTLDTRFDESKKSGEDFTDEDHCWSGITVYAAEHSWIRNVTTRHFGLSSVLLNTGAKNITVKGCSALSPVSSVQGSRRYAFNMNKAQLCLVEDCICDDDRHQYVTGAQVPGPNVFLRCTGTNSRSDAGPHQRWATGVLYDNVKVSGPIIIQDRAEMGSGHGWTGVNFVCYNCESPSICVQSPWVTGQNWAIGCIGTKYASARSYSDNLGNRPDGVWQSPGIHVSPESLYEDQLARRHAKGEYIDK